MITDGKIYISPVLSFYIDVYFPFYYFTTGNLRLPVLHFIPHISQTIEISLIQLPDPTNSVNSTKFENGRPRMFSVSPFTPAHNFTFCGTYTLSFLVCIVSAKQHTPGFLRNLYHPKNFINNHYKTALVIFFSRTIMLIAIK